MKERGRKLSPERKALLATAVADGWPIRQIIATHGFGTRTVKKHHPEYRGQALEDELAIKRLPQLQRIAA